MREDILGGLKSALIRGETLKKAMMTFYNSGYKKNDIEEAAAALQQMISQKVVIQEQTTIAKPVEKVIPKKSPQQLTSFQEVSNYGAQKKSPQPLTSFQEVSNYGAPKRFNKVMVILLIFLLIVLLGILISIFLFKTELIEFFNNAFN